MLAPAVNRDIYAALHRICLEGLAAVIVEQDIDMALRVARRAAAVQLSEVFRSVRVTSWRQRDNTAHVITFSAVRSPIDSMNLVG